MIAKTIEIVVSPEGRTRLQTSGFRGSSCRDASRFLEEALGRTAAERLTAEFYQTNPTQQNNQQHS